MMKVLFMDYHKFILTQIENELMKVLGTKINVSNYQHFSHEKLKWQLNGEIHCHRAKKTIH